MAGTVLVYGATGTQGTPVEDQLLKQGTHTRVVTRDADRATHCPDREEVGRPAVEEVGHRRGEVGRQVVGQS